MKENKFNEIRINAMENDVWLFIFYGIKIIWYKAFHTFKRDEICCQSRLVSCTNQSFYNSIRK